MSKHGEDTGAERERRVSATGRTLRPEEMHEFETMQRARRAR